MLGTVSVPRAPQTDLVGPCRSSGAGIVAGGRRRHHPTLDPALGAPLLDPARAAPGAEGPRRRRHHQDHSYRSADRTPCHGTSPPRGAPRRPVRRLVGTAVPTPALERQTRGEGPGDLRRERRPRAYSSRGSGTSRAMARHGETSGTAADLVPSRRSLKAVREAAAECRACPLWAGATQTVFGEGRRRSRVILLGEQPGDGRIWPGDRSSARPDASWTAPSPRRASTGGTPTSPTW